MLMFRAGSPQPKAVPLSLVTRLEEIDAKTIEISNGRPLVQYRGQLMPLIPVNDEVRIKSERHAAAAGVLRRRPLAWVSWSTRSSTSSRTGSTSSSRASGRAFSARR